MLTALNTGLRFRIAIALTVFAAICFVLPPAALAFGHGSNTAACLSHADAVNHGNMARAYEDGTAHEVSFHGQKNYGDHVPPSGDHQMMCCGLFCLSAVVMSGNEAVDRTALGLPRVTAPALRLVARAPERPERPPNTLSSV